MDYSKTVNLPKTDFPMKADLSRREPAMLEQWERENVYEKALARRKGKEKFILHDGPPYANGHLHLGHALNKILKDMIVRYKTMAGYDAPYVPGWDCHGLPIELALMKEQKIDKSQIDRKKFRADAAAYASKFVEIQKQEFKRMGVLGDWDHPYLTMSESYKKTITDVFETLKKEGYIFKGKKPVYWCFSDETALAEAEVEYENDKGPSIFAAFRSAQDDTLSYVIWTTTPWTLPANLAIAFNPQEQYAIYRNKANHKKYLVAEKLAGNFQKLTGMDLEYVLGVEGSALSGSKAHHPWAGREVPLLPAGFVAMDTGTGLVHIAPGHGREDYGLGTSHKLDVLSPVDSRGRLEEPGMPWNGVHVLKANRMIMDFLQEKGALLYRGEMEHSCPHCWRCHEPVIFRATEQWFLNVEHKELRQRLMKAIGDVQWIPEYGRNRISGMVESRPDWCLSRQRFWGTEIPDPSHPKDPDIFDVWFESGVSWAAVLKQRPELSYPADMYLEGSDQHRGWFQVSLIPSVALENKAPFKAVLTHGFVMDGEGRPMSKSLGNVIAPEQIIKQYGADVLRLWVAASDYGGDVRLSPDILKNQAEAYRKVRNTLRYLLNNLTDFDPAKDAVPYEKLPEIDRWALHRLQEEVRSALAAYEEYKFYRVTSSLVSFCISDLSGFYLDIIKDRLYCDPPSSHSRRSAQTVLDQICSCLIRLLAPILSFTADECWRFFKNSGSITAEDLPELRSEAIDSRLKETWDEVLQLRRDAMLVLERKRQAGLIKRSYEAQLFISVRDQNQFERFMAFENLASILMVSYVELNHVASMEEPWCVEDVLTVPWQKCARCWIYKPDVGTKKEWTDICGRCADAVEVWQKNMAEVKR
jgi:isoleucyl-tRNA synthetase